MLLGFSWLALAEPDNSSADAPVAPALLVAGPADGQSYCAEPAYQFSIALSAAVSAHGVDEELRARFLSHLETCRAVYRYHLQRLASEFDDLPPGAYCHSVRREFIEAEELFDIAAIRGMQLPLDSDEARRAAADFFRHASPALVRAVNGLFLLRHGICVEERIAPFDHPPFQSRINRTYPHIE
ncbi:hypothetical protein [Halopseudomonas sp.]|uniref:hypothetical protein n=1 Tax=Halopseudomonas sp. TaxID=2901191 RepID=UPI0035623DE0